MIETDHVHTDKHFEPGHVAQLAQDNHFYGNTLHQLAFFHVGKKAEEPFASTARVRVRRPLNLNALPIPRVLSRDHVIVSEQKILLSWHL